MRILFLSQIFNPEPQVKGLAFARGLVRRGHTVEVLTGFPNYPGGRLYPGYRVRPWQREIMDGIPVTRVPLYPSHDRSAFRRTLNYASFALSASVLGPLLVNRPDIVYVYHPPATVGLPACALKALRGVPFVYDIQDLWPDTVAATGMMSSPWALGALRRWCTYVYRHADHLTVSSPGFRRALIERGVPDEKITLIPNWCDEEAIRPVNSDKELARRLGLAGHFNILFAGNMGLAQALDAALDAARLCEPINPAIQFVFVGGGVDKSRLEAKARGLSNVIFLAPQPMGEMSRLFALANVLLVHLKDDPLFRITVPSKIQAYLAAAKPILLAVSGDAADLIERAQAGVVVRPQSPREIAEAVLRMSALDTGSLREMGLRGRSFYLRELSMDIGIQQFERLFLSLSARSVKSRALARTGSGIRSSNGAFAGQAGPKSRPR